MLERMDAFFDTRLAMYDEHMLRDIEGAAEFYPATAAALPSAPGCRVLDLGCGTGLELDAYFRGNPTARVTGVDLAPGMLAAMAAKHPGRALTLIEGSYFEVPFGTGTFDACVSVESLHHFTQAEKVPLYRKVRACLRPSGVFILTDYFAEDDADEAAMFAENARLRREEGVPEGAFYHYDTPLTTAHETEALLAAGFSRVTVEARWAATCLLRAER